MPNEQTSTSQPVETPTPMPTVSNQAAAATKPTTAQQPLSNVFTQALITSYGVAGSTYPLEPRMKADAMPAWARSPLSSTRHNFLFGMGKIFFGKSKILNVAPATSVAIAMTAEHNQTSPPHRSNPDNNQNHQDATTTKHKNLAQTGLIYATAAGFDTLTTTYSANRRVHKDMLIQNISGLNTGNLLETAKRTISYGLQSAGTRFARNMTTITGLTAVHEGVNKQLQETRLFDDYRTTLVSGLVSGPVTAVAATPLNNISEWQSRMMTGVTQPQEPVSAPSAWETTKMIASKGGYRGFFHNTGKNAAALTIASSVISGVQHACQNLSGPTA
jgi:hypothetical protein